MSLHVLQSTDLSVLAAALQRRVDDELRAGAHLHPFRRLPVVVGSRGMERWLASYLATHGNRIAALIDFPFPQAALDGAAALVAERWAAGAAASPGDADLRLERYWQPTPRRTTAEPTTAALLPLLRAAAADPDFAAAARYLRGGDARWPQGSVGARELSFAAAVASVLDRLGHERSDTALRWTEAPQSAPSAHRWLAKLLATLAPSGDDGAATAAARWQALASAPAAPTAIAAATLHVFGLSTLSKSEFDRLRLLGRFLDVVLYQPTVCVGFMGDVVLGAADDNPLVRSLGRPSRELQAWVEQALERDGEAYGMTVTQLGAASPPTLSTPAPTTLHTLQAMVRDVGPLSDLAAVAPDTSLELHATYGPARQVEALRDRLLDLLHRDRTLTARDIVVMTPDIATFGPLCAALLPRPVKGSDGKPLSLPLQIADLGLSATNPLAALLPHLLAAPEPTLSAATLVALLQMPVVQHKAGLSSEDALRACALIRDSGMRRGPDARWRNDDGAVSAEHTVRFGLERWALGAVWNDDDDIDAVVAASGVAADDPHALPLRPLPLQDGDDVRLLGVVARLADGVLAARQALQAARPMLQWPQALLVAIDGLASLSAKRSWLRAELADGIADALGVDGAADAKTAADPAALSIEAEAVARLLRGAFEVRQRGDIPVFGGVTVCAMEPMRTVPFRVIALLGMDDGAFPRGGTTPSWSPFAERLEGERERRETDRHLLLEALLAAREHLLVFYSGYDIQSGKALAPAVPIVEWIDVLAAASGHDGKAWVRGWPLQPWSPARFAAGAPACFDAELAARAGALAGGARPSRPRGAAVASRAHVAPVDAVLAGGGGPEGAAPEAAVAMPAAAAFAEEVTVGAVAKDLYKPASAFLRAQLARAEREGDPVDLTHPPFEINTLEKWQLRNALLTAVRDDVRAVDEDGFAVALADWATRLPPAWRGAGQLPAGSLGDAVVKKVVDEVARAGKFYGPALVAAADAVVVVDGVALRSDELALAGETLVLLTSKGKANASSLLEGLLHLLVRRAAGASVPPRLQTAGYDGGEALLLAAEVDALAELRRLVRLWRLCRQVPLPLFAQASRSLATIGADSAADGDSDGESDGDGDGDSDGAIAAQLEAAAAEFGSADDDSPNSHSDLQDPDIALLWHGLEPTAGLPGDDALRIHALAKAVWLPVERACGAAKAAADAAKPAKTASAKTATAKGKGGAA